MRFPIFWKEARDIIREKTFISTVLLQIFLIAFYSFAILGILVIFNPGGSSQPAIETKLFYEGERPYPLEELFMRSRSFKLVDILPYDPLEIQDELTFKGLIIIYQKDPNFGYDYIRLFLEEGSFETTYSIAETKKLLEVYEEKLRRGKTNVDDIPVMELTEGIDMDSLTIRRLVFEFTYLIMVPLLFFLPIYLSGTLAIDILTEDFKRKTLRVLSTAPITIKSIVNQKVTAAFALSALQILLWVLIIRWRNIPLNHPWSLLTLLILVNIVFLQLSALISLAFRERVNAQTIFSLFFVLVILTKNYVFNPLNLIVQLSILDPRGNFILGYGLLCISIVIGLDILIKRSIKKLRRDGIDS